MLKKILGIIAIFECEQQNAVKKALKLEKFRFTALPFSVFGTVRELVGEIKYALSAYIPKGHIGIELNCKFVLEFNFDCCFRQSY